MPAAGTPWSVHNNTPGFTSNAVGATGIHAGKTSDVGTPNESSGETLGDVVVE